jgi:Beta-propeller repeat
MRAPHLRLSYLTHALATRTLQRALAAMAPVLAALPSAAQNQLWLQQLGTSGSEGALGASQDGTGGEFVGGNTSGSLAGPSAGSVDAWFAHYDGAGNLKWMRQLGTSAWEQANAFAPDGAGGVYVCGYTEGSLGGSNAGEQDGWLAHFDSAGNQLWIRQLGTRTSDFTYAAAPDSSGGVLVTGVTSGDLAGTSAGGDDAWIARYDSAGNLLWIRQLGSDGSDEVYAAAADGAGGVYISGWTSGSLGGTIAGTFDAWLARYDQAGNQLWVRQLGSAVDDYSRGVAADGTGGVFVSGMTGGSLGGSNAGGYDAWIARYDSAGNSIWIRQLGTSATDYVYNSSPDGAGGAFISGSTSGNLGGSNAGAADAWLAQFDGAGNRRWIAQLGSAGVDFALASAPDSSGGVFVSGVTEGSLGGPSAGGFDAWLARFGSCGASGSYCTASSTSIPGCQAAIAATGTPSLSNPTGFTITSGSVPGGKVGICFFGKNGPANIPFGTLGGSICVQPPFVRSSAKQGGGTNGVCNGNYSFTLQDLINASTIVVAGAAINAELWARDPANPDGFLLSNGLEFVVCP